jgi:hypothetical protein
LWTSFETKESGLETLLFDFEKGRIVASRTSQFVLCLYGGIDCPFGMLKSKAMALAEHLQVSEKKFFLLCLCCVVLFCLVNVKMWQNC